MLIGRGLVVAAAGARGEGELGLAAAAGGSTILSMQRGIGANAEVVAAFGHRAGMIVLHGQHGVSHNSAEVAVADAELGVRAPLVARRRRAHKLAGPGAA